MDEVPSGTAVGAAPPDRAGEVLRAARERLGLSLAEVGARTRVPLRHLEAIEASDYFSLPSPTYATGFAKAFARSVGADEVEIARQVRNELARSGRRTPEYQPHEVADPSRVPSRAVAIAGLGVALAVLILVGLWFGTDLLRGGGTGGAATGYAPPDAIAAGPDAPPAANALPGAATLPGTASSPAATGGQVTLAAADQDVWMRVYDADDKTLYLGTLKAGDRFDVPADARNPQINVGRPDRLRITLNGAAVPPLGTGERPLKDVAIGPAALAARIAGTTAAPHPAATSTPSAGATPRRTRPTRSRSRADRQLTETQRANLDSAPPPPAPGNSQ